MSLRTQIPFLRNGLVVSCQAAKGSPLNQPRVIAAMAMAAERSGAVAVRIEGVRNIRAVRRFTKIPIIGIEKAHSHDSPVYITPTFASLKRVMRAGADIVAIDGTGRRRPRGESLVEIIEKAKAELHVTIMADISNSEEGALAAKFGADLVATTMNGYTDATRCSKGPAFALLARLVKSVQVPVILEGRVRFPSEVRRAFHLGAYAVVVGKAITGIDSVLSEFVAATPRAAN